MYLKETANKEIHETLPPVVFKDNWLVSFMDILLLFITMLSVLIVLKPEDKHTEAEIYQFKPPVFETRVEKVLTENNNTSTTPHSTQITIQDNNPVTEKQAGNTETENTNVISSTIKSISEPVKQKTEILASPDKFPLLQTPLIVDHYINDITRIRPVIEKSENKPMQMAKLINLASTNNIDITQFEEGLILTLKDHILFSTGSAELINSGKSALEKLFGTIESFQGKISIEGHTDNIPISTKSFPSNWELSSARASTVARQLIAFGMPSNRIRTIGYADTKPLADNKTPEGRNTNRRVSILLHFDNANTASNIVTL